MPLPDSYLAALEAVAAACGFYEAATGHRAVLVGGAAAAIYTDGAFPSADFDMIAADDAAFAVAMQRAGFIPEDRAGFLRVGFYHPDHLQFGVQQVSGALFDGHTDGTRLLRVVLRDQPELSIVLPPIEDMIADRLGQHAAAAFGDDSRLRQAQAMARLAEGLDWAYLARRVAQEGGNIHLLGMPGAGP